METKRFILSISIMMLLVIAWKQGVAYMYAKHPEWAAQEPVASTQPSAAEVSTATTAPSTMPTPVAGISAATGTVHATGAETGTPANIGSAVHGNATYSVGLAINPAGAGLSSVTLNQFFETAEQKSLYIFQQPVAGFEAESTPLATRSVTVNGVSVDVSRLNWSQISSSPANATYRATVEDAGKPELEIDKTFEVFPKDTAEGRGGYEIRMAMNFKNLATKTLVVKSELNGTLPPARENDRSEDRQFMAGFDKGYQEVDVGHAFVGELSKEKPTKDLAAIEKLPLLWAGAGSSYFNAIVRAEPVGGAVKIVGASAFVLNPDAAADDRLAGMKVETNEIQLAAGATAPLDLRVYFGPKQRSVLTNSYYSAFPLGYDGTLIYSGGFCGFMTFTWLTNVLYWILFFFHMIFRDWGVAIICLVCLVRVILHPITKKSQVNMMGMSKMGPEIERIKKKYGDNKDELNKAMMGFYKEQGATPILGCLPMLLQTPIWIALWSALQSTFDLRQAGFLRFGWLHLTWIKDLSHPDLLVHFNQPLPIPLTSWHLQGINVLPILMGAVYFFQQKVQPQPPNQTPEQMQQRKMMSWMTLLFPLMLYTGPSGLNLYILTSSSLGIIESKIIRDHIKEREEAEKAGRIIVDAKPTRAGKRRDKEDKNTKEKKGGLMGWIADLQAKADEIRRDAER